MRLPLQKCWLPLLVVLLLARALAAREWTEEDFDNKESLSRIYVAVPGHDLETSTTVIGSSRYYQVEKKDTFLDIARYADLGYNEFEEANPGIDPWVPPNGQLVLLPTQWILPDVETRGVVVNIPEMRLYYFHGGGSGTVLVTTYPVGLGRDEWRTPEGKFKITEKNVDPRWVLTDSIKREHIREGKPAPDFIEGGDPENPLGRYRLRLTLPLYGIHGTNIPWGVGMQVSHGCIRLYPEDIDKLFPQVPVGAAGEFVYQPVKVGVRDRRVYVEIHKDIYDLRPGLYREVTRIVEKYGWQEAVDWNRVERAVSEQSGVPMDVSRDAEPLLPEETFKRRTPKVVGEWSRPGRDRAPASATPRIPNTKAR